MKIVITGATGSIGGTLARTYAKDGHSLVLQGRKADQLALLSDECVELGAKVLVVSFDLSNLEQTRRWCDELNRHWFASHLSDYKRGAHDQ